MAKVRNQRWYVSNPLFLTFFLVFMADAGVSTIRGASSLFGEQLRTEVADWSWFALKLHMSFLENVALARMRGEY